MAGVIVLLNNVGADAGVDITGEWFTWFGGPGDMWVWGDFGGGTIHLEAALEPDEFVTCVTGTEMNIEGVVKFNFNHGTQIRAVLTDTTGTSSEVTVKVN